MMALTKTDPLAAKVGIQLAEVCPAASSQGKHKPRFR